MTLHNVHQDDENRQYAFVAAAARLKRRLPALPDRPALDSPPPVPSERRQRSLQTGHRYRIDERPRRATPSESRAPISRARESRAYVPELAARIDDDPNLTDGARRCARKLAEETYRRNRQGRTLAVTVTYLARALGRCRRTVQRYLRQLERGGYIETLVVAGTRSRLCIGLVVRLLERVFAGHHKARWPGRLGNPGATAESLNQRDSYSLMAEGLRFPVERWAQRCMDGVFRAFMETRPVEACLR